MKNKCLFNPHKIRGNKNSNEESKQRLQRKMITISRQRSRTGTADISLSQRRMSMKKS